MVLGLRLRPFSLGHEILLTTRQNLVFCSGAEEFAALPWNAQMAALREAVWITANSWRENQGERAVRLKVWLWARRTRTANVALEAAKFQEYLAAAHARFPAPDNFSSTVANGDRPEEKGRALGSPLLAHLLLYAGRNLRALRTLAGVTDLYDLPLGLVANLYLADMEGEGRVRVENAEEARVRAQMEQARAEALAEEAKEQACQP